MAGRYDKGQKVLVKLECPNGAPESFAIFAPDGYIPEEKEYHAWDYQSLRHVNEGTGPLYLPGIILCKHIIRNPKRRIEYCVHVPPDETHSFLEVGHTTKESLLAPNCSKHQLDNMLCHECVGEMIPVGKVEMSAQSFMLTLGYVCTIRVFEDVPIDKNTNEI